MIIQFSLDHLPLFEAKLLAKCQGRTAFEVFAIDSFLMNQSAHMPPSDSSLFAGRLASIMLFLRNLLHQLYSLTEPMSQIFNFSKRWIREPGCLFVHLAPPCGRASRERFIKRFVRYNKPVLRTDEHPNM